MATEPTQSKRTGGAASDWKIIPLAESGPDIFVTPDPDGVSVGSPSILALPSGRLVVSLDLSGPGVKHVQGNKGRDPETGHWLQGRVLVSSDKGATWAVRTDYQFHQARLFRTGGTVNLLGRSGNFRLMRSLDGGERWSKASDLDLPDGDATLGTFTSVCVRDQIYIGTLARMAAVGDQPPINGPVIWHARQGADLSDRKVWTRSEPVPPLNEFIPAGEQEAASLQVLEPVVPARKGERRSERRLEWSGPHLLDVPDSAHPWHDPQGRSLYMLAACRSSQGNVAIVGRWGQDEAGRMIVDRVPPTGRALMSLPGGSQPFDVVYDEDSRLYWLVSYAILDSMARRDRRPTVPGGAGEQRTRLQLHFSRNLIDWNFAGVLEVSTSPDARLGCRMALGGGNLYLVCASGRARPRGYAERISFHTVTGYRDLVY